MKFKPEVAECYLITDSIPEIKNIYTMFKEDEHIMDPQLVKKANGSYCVMCAFDNGDIFKSVKVKMNDLFPKKISWR